MLTQNVETNPVLNFLADGPKTARECYAAVGGVAGRMLGALVRDGLVERGPGGVFELASQAEARRRAALRVALSRLVSDRLAADFAA